MTKRLSAAALAALVLIGAGGWIVVHRENHSDTLSVKSQDKSIVHVDRAPIDSAAQLATYSEYVVAGTFVSAAGKGRASDYRMGVAGSGDFPVELWNFRADHYFKGSGQRDLVVVRYDPDHVIADDAAPTAVGYRAVVFLTQEVNGARVIAGGAQGVLARGSGGELQAVSAEGSTFHDATTEQVLAETLGHGS